MVSNRYYYQTFNFLYFQHTNRKLSTRRTKKLPIVKLQLDRLGWHMTPKNQTFNFLFFQHTNRKLWTRRTNKLLIVKHQLDRLVCHMINKNPTFYFCTFSIPIESSRRGEQISCLLCSACTTDFNLIFFSHKNSKFNLSRRDSKFKLFKYACMES